MDITIANSAKRILVVDDDPDIQQLFVAALKTEDLHIEGACDGVEGLDKFTRAHWDLVITDVMMPKMDGMELLERMHALRTGTPVVVMTVDTTTDKIITAVRENAYCWLRKPFTTEDLRQVVDEALNAAPLEEGIEVLSASPRWLEFRLRCDMETAQRALRFLREVESGLQDSERERISFAFREILFNAVEHGGGNNPDVYVTVTYMRAERAILFRVRDPGPGFSFQRLRHAAISNPMESPAEHAITREQMGLRPGGFGILLVRQFVDELLYNEQGNEALLIKYLSSPA